MEHGDHPVDLRHEGEDRERCEQRHPDHEGKQVGEHSSSQKKARECDEAETERVKRRNPQFN